MNAKVTTILLIALVGVLAVWAGIGFGLGALSVAPSITTSYNSTPYNLDNAIEWQVNITSYTQAGDVPTTAISPSGSSSVVTFTASMWAPSLNTPNSPCNKAQNPIWAPGKGANWGAVAISLGQPFLATLGNGSQVSASSGTYYMSLNSSNVIAWCDASGLYPGASGSIQSGSANIFVSESLTFQGVYQPTTLTVSLIGHGSNCVYNALSTGTSSSTACYYEGQDGTSMSPTGSGWNIDATASIGTQSGYAYVGVTNQGQVAYDGGTLNAQATTGYGGPSGYTAYVTYPAVRTNGGQVDSQFAPISVPNDCLTPCSFSWTVPAGTSQPSYQSSLWNDFTVVLVSANGYVTGQATVGIDISPGSGPQPPTISTSNSGTFTGPQVGDTMTVTVTAPANVSSGAVTSVNLFVYYGSGNSPPASQPPCGSASWVTSCSGDSLSVSGGQASYSFLVNPPPGSTQVIIQAQAANAEAQVSPIVTATTNIVPSNCQPGVYGCPLGQALNLWEILGPALLSAAFILFGLLVAFSTPDTRVRVFAIVIPVALVIVLYAFGIYTHLFDPGGFLNQAR